MVDPQLRQRSDLNRESQRERFSFLETLRVRVFKTAALPDYATLAPKVKARGLGEALKLIERVPASRPAGQLLRMRRWLDLDLEAGRQ